MNNSFKKKTTKIYLKIEAMSAAVGDKNREGEEGFKFFSAFLSSARAFPVHISR